MEEPEEVNIVNSDPPIVSETFTLVKGFFQLYGWFVVIGLIVLFLLKSKFQQRLNTFSERRRDAHYKKVDDNEALARLERIQQNRERLQRQYDEVAARAAEKQREVEEQKRLAKIEDWERHQEGNGYRSKVKKEGNSELDKMAAQHLPKPTSKKVYRSADYNPLMGGGGSGGSSGYRPSKRGGAGGGGG